MIPALQHKNNILSVDNTPLIVNRITESYLTADAASGSGTLTVANIEGFAVDQALIIGELGSENAELVKTHGSTAPSGTTVTLLANTGRAHYSGDPVYAIQYDQLQFAHADTATGSKTTFTAVNIDPTEKVQRYEDTTESVGFYFARYVDSIDTVNGSYTDALAFGGWASNTVGYMIKSALRRLGRTLDQKVTLEYCFDEINEALRYIEGKQLRWPTHYAFDYVAGQTSFGSNTVTLPTDIYDDTSNKST